MYTINVYNTSGAILASYKHLSQEEAYSLFASVEDGLEPGEQVIMLEGLTFIMSATKR